MRILVQWTRRGARDWEALDSRLWVHTARKPDPTGTDPPLDDRPGWVSAINVQGVVFEGADHYAVEHLQDDLLRVTTWSDTGPADERVAQVWTFSPVAPDSRFNGAYNTRQTRVVYTAPGAAGRWFVPTLPWASFIPPAASVTRHGKQLADTAHVEHRVARRHAGWREFTDGVPVEELVGGKVPAQRILGRYPAAEGTRTYYCSTTALATGVHAASNELQASTTTGSMGQDTESVARTSQELTHVWTTPANEPNSADWPSGNYRCQLDVSAAGASLTYGFLTLTGAAGHFARVNSGLTADQQTWAQAESAFSGTGLKLASTGTIDPTAGAAGDRWECLLAVANAGSKAEDITLDLNESDDYTDGPWPAATTYVTAQVCSSAGTAVAAGVSPGPVNIAAGVAATTATAPDAGVLPGSVNAPAEVASATGQPVDAAVVAGAVNVPATVAAAVGAASEAGVNPGAVNVPATVAASTGAAPDASVLGSVLYIDAEVTSSAGAAPDSTVLAGPVQVAAQVAASTGTAPAADVNPGAVWVPAEAAAATGTPLDAGVNPGAVTVPAQVTSAASAAPDAAVNPGAVTVPAQVAPALASTLDAGVALGVVNVPAEVASSAAAAPDAAVAAGPVQVAAEVVTSAAVAPDAGVNPGTVWVPAGVAAAVGTPPDAAAGILSLVSAEVVAAAAAALNAGVLAGPVQVVAQAPSAAATAPAADVMLEFVLVPAEVAVASGLTLDADVPDIILQVAAQVAAAVARVCLVEIAQAPPPPEPGPWRHSEGVLVDGEFLDMDYETVLIDVGTCPRIVLHLTTSGPATASGVFYLAIANVEDETPVRRAVPLAELAAGSLLDVVVSAPVIGGLARVEFAWAGGSVADTVRIAYCKGETGRRRKGESRGGYERYLRKAQSRG